MKSSPSFAIKIAIGLVMLLTGILLFFVIGIRSDALAILGTSKHGFDPLSKSEQTTVSRAALNNRAVTSLLSPNDGNSIILLVERHQETKETMERGDWRRRADQYIYDYASDTLVHVVVDVASGEIDELEAVQGVQLPLIEAEIERAAEIAFADAEVRSTLEAQYRAVYGVPLASLDQLSQKAFIFRADSMPNDVNEATAQCGIQRCAQLLLYTQDDIALELLPIVNLSAETVTQSLNLGEAARER